MCGERPALRHCKRCHYGDACPFGVGEGGVDNVGHRMAAHLASADGRECVPGTGEKKPQVIVDFG